MDTIVAQCGGEFMGTLPTRLIALAAARDDPVAVRQMVTGGPEANRVEAMLCGDTLWKKKKRKPKSKKR